MANRGLFGTIEDTMTSPLWLGGAALLTGEGMSGAMQGMRTGAGFQQQRRQQQEDEERKRRFQGLVSDPSQMQGINPALLRVAQAAGPEQGWKVLADAYGRMPTEDDRRFMEARTGLVNAQTEAARAQALRAQHEMSQPQLPLGEAERIKAMAREQGKAQGQAISDLPRVETTAERIIEQIEAIENDPRLPNVTGWQARFPTFNPRNVDTEERIAQLGGAAFLQAFESLKGGGQITEIEGKKATDALARLTNLKQSDEGFKEALADFKREVKSLVEIARRRAGAPAAQQGQTGMGEPEATRTIDGQTYVKIGGQWYAQ